jgi:hypothetical protein
MLELHALYTLSYTPVLPQTSAVGQRTGAISLISGRHLVLCVYSRRVDELNLFKVLGGQCVLLVHTTEGHVVSAHAQLDSSLLRCSCFL